MNENISTNIYTNSKAKPIDLNFISIYNRWNIDYTIKVFLEYERFLELRNQYSELSPSNDIDKFWHTHILNTKSYYFYCINKFNKIIHHDPVESLNQNKRKQRLENTIKKYIEKFGIPTYPEIWNLESNLTNNINNTISNKKDTESNYESLVIPNYNNDNSFNNKNTIRLFIFYSFDDGYSRPDNLEGIYIEKDGDLMYYLLIEKFLI